MHTHIISDENLGPAKLFNCAIRNQEELLTERIEIHRGETLHGHDDQNIEWPLLKFDENAFWVYMPKQEIWWPLRQGKIKMDLDRFGRVCIKWLDLPSTLL